MKQLPKISKQSCYYIDLKKTDNAYLTYHRKTILWEETTFKNILDSSTQVQVSKSDRREREKEVERAWGYRPFGIS